ncbi:MAG: hypothetical protein DRJ05_11220 [Bacteroidetes bacterium]|nr:MAG: hypothetical protein DRJ05_11220 [Bacteroidota bacterium]
MKYHWHIIFPVLFFSILLSSNIIAQETRSFDIINYPSVPDTYCNLPDKVDETSGLIYLNGFVWTFNDSGGEPEIYKIDNKSGKIIQTVRITNGGNFDWEDITHDDDFIYIGDFGNNWGTRKDLKIYKIAINDITDKKKVQLEAEIIEFSYTDQVSFKKNNRGHDYDCESVINYQDSLIIFSKNWGNGRTRMYKLPKTPGNYKIAPINSFNADGLVTGASYNKETGELVLIGYKDYVPFIYCFSEFDGNNFKNGNAYRINMVKMKGSQTEGIVWYDNDNILISTEQKKEFDQKVYKLQIKDIIKSVE